MNYGVKNKRHRHYQSHTRLYKIWDDMIQRTTNSNAPNYSRYGGKGVKVCDEWRNDYRAFWAWAVSQRYDDDIESQKARKDRLTIDRIDSSGDYCPENCRWATYQEQSLNKKNTIRVEFEGEERTLCEIAEIVGINYFTLYQRLVKCGWTIDRDVA